MNFLIKNGTVITSQGRQRADVAVNDGRIAAVIPQNEAGSSEAEHSGYASAVDATGLFVLPGAIDAHTHFELGFPGAAPGGGTLFSADSFFTGTREAACGGVTTVIDFVTPERGENLMQALDKRREAADLKVCIDYALHLSLLQLRGSTKAEMIQVQNAGVTGFKVFMTYDFRLGSDDFRRVLEYAKDIDALIMVHAEAHEPIESLRQKFIRQGKTDPYHHYLSRPESVEAQGVRQAVKLAGETGSALYVVHLACAEGLACIEAAQKRGSRIYAETCPQYLHFTSDVYKRPDAQNFVCSPPMKDEKSRSALLHGIKNGSISTVATDHCPFMLGDKARHKNDFTKIPNGVMGTGILYPYILSLANTGHITFERAVELCCENPARIFKLDNRKGTIAPGMDADIVLYDPDKEFMISHKNSHSAADYTIWEGVRLNGYPAAVYSRGVAVSKNGKFCGFNGYGKFLPAAAQ